MSSVHFEQFERLWKRVEEKFISESSDSFTLENLRNHLISQNLLPGQTDLKPIEAKFLDYLSQTEKPPEVKLSNTIFNTLNKYVEIKESSDSPENVSSDKNIHELLTEAFNNSVKKAPPPSFLEIGFLGRENEASELENFLRLDESCIFALYGVPMIGKTELVNHFLENSKIHENYEIKIVEIKPRPENAEQKIKEVVFADGKFNDFSDFPSNTLIIIRNFELALQLTGDVEELHDIKNEYAGIKTFLSEAVKANNIKIIIESRYQIRFDVFLNHLKTKINFLPDIQLKGVEREEFWRFYRLKNFSRKEFDDLCNKFDDHTWLLARAYNTDDVIFFDNNLLKALTQFKQTTRFLWKYIETILDQLENQEVLILCVLTRLKEPVKKENLYEDFVSLSKLNNQSETNSIYFESELQIDDFFTSLQQKLLIQTDINGFYDLNPYLQELFYTFLKERRKSLMLIVSGLPYVQQHGMEPIFDEIHQALERNDYMSLFDLGRELRKEGEYSKAIEAFEAGLTIDPKKANILTEIAITYKWQKKWYKAIETLEKAKKINPNDVKTLNELGICYRKNRQLDKAIVTLEKAKKINPNDVKTLNELAICYRENHQLDKAIETLEKAVELGNIHSYNELAICYRENHQLDKAIETLEKAVELGNIHSYNELAICYRENHQLDKAIETLEKAVENHPDNVKILNELAICYRENHQLDKAIETLEQAKENHPDNVKILSVLAETYKESGDIEKAYEVAQKGVKASNGKDRRLNNQLRELEQLLRQQKQENVAVKKLKVFLSYSHKDEGIKEELDVQLAGLKRTDKISTWSDRKISLGTEWDNQIKQELDNADIILLLISADFIASEYIWNIEIKKAIEKHEKNEAVVIPIFCRACDFHEMPFAKLQGLPKDAKFIMSQPNKDEALAEVAKGIRAVVGDLLS